MSSLCAALAIFVFALTLKAQHPSGEIRLELKDPSGAAMSASGRLLGPTPGAIRSFQTDAQGVVNINRLPYGSYRLEIAKKGFAAQSLSIEVRSDTPVSQVVTLELGQGPAGSITVITATPLPGMELDRGQVAAPVQTADQLDIERSGAINLSDFMNRRLNGVFLNEVQGNPFQPDLNYRGYTASPLLGTPQGLSVYMDGVRLNQPFGDVVSWDLIPLIAISETTLIPGSNPLFGLNTLGGALSVQTKDGNTAPGTQVQVSGGSYGRKTVDFEQGGSNARGLNWYGAGNLFFDDGWRAVSPSNVRQFFGKLGWQHANTALGLSVSYANNHLNGSGVQEQRFLARDYASLYTKPDVTTNRSPFLNFTARHSLTNNWSVFGNVYYRYIRSTTYNADINENSLDQAVYQPSAAERTALTAAGYSGFPVSGATADNTPFPFWRCIGQSLLNDEPAEKCNGLINRTRSEQHNSGFAGQVAWSGSPGGHRNQFTAGAAFDRSSVDFQQSSQLGYLNPDRSITAVNSFGDGVHGGNVDGAPYDTRVDLHGLIQTGSVYGTDTLSIGNAWNFTLSGRYNRTTIDNDDRIQPLAGSGSLTSRNVFDRFNPAAGVTFNPGRGFNAYFGYNEGSRAPTSTELGCADPNQPCKLPNAMASDPPLLQVVTRTLEAGVRGDVESNLRWSLGWFRGENRNDILFVASTQTGFGYFKNFGKTRRQGLEIDANGRIRRVTLGGGYTFLDATYQSAETVDGSSNNTNTDGFIQIKPGAKIPFIPSHMLKAYADVQVTSKFLVDLGLTALSNSYARGNENNLHKANGPYYLGPGTSPGFAVVNLGARYQVNRRVQLFVQVNNLFDRRYYTAAQLGPTGFSSQGNFIARPFPAVDGEFPVQHATFYAPGAPRIVAGGIRFRF
ncbi:MAG: TonB-dependent receptor [Bryobacteraceae bacterium]